MHALAPVKAPGPARGGTRPGDVDKLRKALAAEHAAVFAYGLLGARTAGSMRVRITRAYDAHRARRDELRGLITALGGKPAEPAPSYALPSVPSTARPPPGSRRTWRAASWPPTWSWSPRPPPSCVRTRRW